MLNDVFKKGTEERWIQFYGEQMISKADFEEMKSIFGEWRFEDCSYRNRFLDKRRCRYGQFVHFGHFYYRDPNIYGYIKNSLLQIVVKCYYEEIDDENVRIVFLPWTIMNSVSYDMICKNNETLYERTEFGKWLKEQPTEFFEDTQKIDFLYHAYLCFLDIYTLKLFLKRFSKELKGVEIKTVSSSIRGNFSEILDKTAHELLTKTSRIDMVIEIEKVKEDGKLVEVEGLPTSIPEEYVNPENFIWSEGSSIYLSIYYYMLKKKRQQGENAFIAIEELKTILEKDFPKMYREERLIGMVTALSKMLEKQMLINDIESKGGIIYYGFRCGENSDIILPFYNNYIFYGINCLYKKYPDKNEFSQKVTEFSKKLIGWLLKKDYMYLYFTRIEININKIYFTDKNADLETLVKNKQFWLDHYFNVGRIEWEIDEIIKKI